MNTLNTKTRSSKETAEFSFENADVKSICYCKQRMEGTLSLSSECVERKLCKPCTSFISHLHGSCGMVRYRTLRVNPRAEQGHWDLIALSFRFDVTEIKPLCHSSSRTGWTWSIRWA